MSDTSAKPDNPTHVLQLAGKIAHIFIQSKLTPLVIVGALASRRVQYPADAA